MNKAGLRYFVNHASALSYGWGELLNTLREDLENMEGPDRAHYTDEDRQNMRDMIADLASLEYLFLLKE